MEVPGLSPKIIERFGAGLRRAIAEGLAIPPVKRPAGTPYNHRSKKQLERLEILKKWRSSLGESLSMDPSLLWSRASLERIAYNPDVINEEIGSGGVSNWQRREFGDSVRKLLGNTR